ncbi:MAG: hypothetical protein IKF71_00990 [Bacilli bacterium]|nr:hypothetical protein [Bacilli bacterium]
MNELSFDTTKLNEVCDMLNTYYLEYKELVSSLNQEILKLENTWGSRNQSAYLSFKEKYDEKKGKLLEIESMIKELQRILELKKEEIQAAAIQAENSFE